MSSFSNPENLGTFLGSVSRNGTLEGDNSLDVYSFVQTNTEVTQFNSGFTRLPLSLQISNSITISNSGNQSLQTQNSTIFSSSHQWRIGQDLNGNGQFEPSSETLEVSNSELFEPLTRELAPGNYFISVEDTSVLRVNGEEITPIPNSIAGYEFTITIPAENERLDSLKAIGGLDTAYYLNTNPDVASSGIDPLVHYAKSGAKEGRSPHPLFDSSFYLNSNPDVLEALAGGVLNDPLTHYIQSGASEGRDPNPYFDSDYYLTQNPDVADAGFNPLEHYVLFGSAQGRDPSPNFDPDFYLSQNPDVAAAGLDPLAHFLTFGQAEGRLPIA